jgi:choline dehydrogenase-like flavoprotein
MNEPYFTFGKPLIPFPAFCRVHDNSNLFVVDGSFYPFSAAFNPALTIASQALRVGEHIRKPVV